MRLLLIRRARRAEKFMATSLCAAATVPLALAAVAEDAQLKRYPLAYRISAGDAPTSSRYVVVFRTSGDFRTKDADGNTQTGTVKLVDSFDAGEGFSTLDKAKRCFAWSLPQASALSRVKLGRKVTLVFDLNGATRPQGRKVTLRGFPRAASGDGATLFKRRAFQRSIGQIGC